MIESKEDLEKAFADLCTALIELKEVIYSDKEDSEDGCKCNCSDH